jgi:hypothetical protein
MDAQDCAVRRKHTTGSKWAVDSSSLEASLEEVSTFVSVVSVGFSSSLMVVISGLDGNDWALGWAFLDYIDGCASVLLR